MSIIGISLFIWVETDEKTDGIVIHQRSRDFNGNLISRRAGLVGIDGSIIEERANGDTYDSDQ